jgi:hypothetical protein
MRLLHYTYVAVSLMCATVLARDQSGPAKPRRKSPGVIASGNPTTQQLLQQEAPAARASSTASDSGRIEVHWRFESDIFGTQPLNGDLWIQYYEGANPNPGKLY